MSLSKEDKTFEYFLEVPSEIRKMFIDEMSGNARCRFSRCSKLSEKEAKSSKNYLFGLGFKIDDEDITVSVIYQRFDREDRQINRGFDLNFKTEEDGKTYMKCFVYQGNVELWKIELKPSKPLVQIALQHFKNYAEPRQMSIKKLSIVSRNLYELDFDSGITSLKRLENLKIDDLHDYSTILSKIQKPLKKLEVEGFRNIHVPEKMIYEVQSVLDIRHLKLSYDEFLKLSAKDVSISIGTLTEWNLFSFIKSWLEGTNKERWTTNYKYFFRLNGSNFQTKTLLDMLGLQSDEEKTIQHINHPKEEDSFVMIGCSPSSLRLTFSLF